MKPSRHPPLYLLVATVSFFLGTLVDLPARSDPPVIRGVSAQNSSGKFPDSNASDQTDERGKFSPSNNAASSTHPAESASAWKKLSPQQTAQLNSPPVLHTRLGDVSIFSRNNAWNQEISSLPVHPESTTWLRSIGLTDRLHPDFGTVWNGAPNGIPFVTVDSTQPKVPVKFKYDDESDPGPYPIPKDAPIEGGPNAPHDSDRHIIMIDPQKKLLYELFQAIPDPVFGWRAGSGAIFDLGSDKLRPDGWTSADAAGLPVFPGLVRYEEVAAGEIRHALRFTVERTQRAYIHPARHFASRHTDNKLPPMGLRVRLRADYDLTGFPRSAQVILTALKKYGMLLADNGSNWFISGSPDPRWKDDDLATLKRVKGSDFECVYTGPLKR